MRGKAAEKIVSAFEESQQLLYAEIRERVGAPEGGSPLWKIWGAAHMARRMFLERLGIRVNKEPSRRAPKSYKYDPRIDSDGNSATAARQNAGV